MLLQKEGILKVGKDVHREETQEGLTQMMAVFLSYFHASSQALVYYGQSYPPSLSYLLLQYS